MLKPCIILVNSFHPGNIGSVARAMKTMGLDDLRLVTPKGQITDHSYAMAAGATDVLQQTLIYDDLKSASLDLELLIATSADQRKPERPLLTPEQSAQLCWQPQRVGLVFGGERDGLSLEQIRQCSHLCHIAGNPDYDVLNLSHAVQILCWEVKKARPKESPKQTPVAQDAACLAEIESLLAQWQLQLQLKGNWLDAPAEHQRWQRLRSLIYQQQFSKQDFSLLNGYIRRLCHPSKKQG